MDMVVCVCVCGLADPSQLQHWAAQAAISTTTVGRGCCFQWPGPRGFKLLHGDRPSVLRVLLSLHWL